MKRLILCCICGVLLAGCSSPSTEKTKTVGMTGNPKVGDRVYTDGKWWKVSEVSVNGEGVLGMSSRHYCKLVAEEEATKKEEK